MELAQRAFDYIREFREYAGLAEIAQSFPPQQRYEITGDAPELRLNLHSILEREFEMKPFRFVPDSDDFALVDIGSGSGKKFPLPFAKIRPNVHVYMVDELDEADIKGYDNVRYIRKTLGFGSLELGIEEELKGKNVVVTGFKNPYGLGNLTVLEAIRLCASRVFLNNSALERIEPDSGYFSWLRSFLHENAFSGIEEIIGMFKDGEVKYCYDCGKKNDLALALKLLFVLAQKAKLEEQGYRASVFLNDKGRKNNHFNQPDLNLAGWKES